MQQLQVGKLEPTGSVLVAVQRVSEMPADRFRNEARKAG
jgi:hypothetical protein